MGCRGEAHVVGAQVLRGGLVQRAPRPPRHDRVLGRPPVLAEEVLLVDDLGRRPAELEVGQPDLALALGAEDRGAAQPDTGRYPRARPQELAAPDHHAEPPTLLLWAGA